MRKLSLGLMTILVSVFAFMPNTKALSHIPTTLTQDYTLTEQENILEDEEVVINLNGKTLTLDSTSSARLIINEGKLTIKNGTIVNNSATSYGDIDNYGKLIIDDVTFKSNGAGDGSTIKNRPSGTSSLTVTNSRFINTGETLGNACIYSDGKLIIKNSDFKNSSLGAYAIIVGSGEAEINNATVTAAKGAIAISSGTAVINSGTYTGGKYYGVWITNDGLNTDVTINGGKFSTERNALYAAIDDGDQDTSNVTITINDGEFASNSDKYKAVDFNYSNSQNTWNINIAGGTYKTNVTEHIADGYTTYKVSDTEYVVDKRGSLEVYPNTIYLRIGETFSDIYTSDLVKYITTTLSSDDDIIKVTGTKIEGLKAGQTTITIKLNDTVNPIEKKVNVVVYDIKDTTLEADQEGLMNESVLATISKEVGEILKKILANEDVEGIDEDLAESIKQNFLANKTIGSKLVIEQVEEITTSDDEILEKVEKNSVIDGYFDAQIIVTAEDTAELGNINKLENAIKITLPIPDDLEPVKEGYERVFTVVRIHDGEIVKLPTVDNNDGTVSFNSNLFSDFVLTHIDVEKNELDDVPTTGEIMIPLGIIALISLVAAAALNTLRKVDEVR